MGNVVGYYMTSEIAEMFFTLCQERNAVTRQDKLNVMNELIHIANVKIIKENQLKAILDNKKILHVKIKEETENG